MLLFAREQFRFDKRRKDGSTLREHLSVVWEQTREMPRELAEAPPLPESGSSVWAHFVDLSQFRGSNGFGPNPLTPADILAWSQLSRNRLEMWEIRAISMLDRAYLAVMGDDDGPG